MLNLFKFSVYIVVLPLSILALNGCGGCGFECNKNNENDPAPLSLGLSGSVKNNLKSVTLEIDAITFRRTGKKDVVINTFTIKEKNITDEETFQIDLLDLSNRDLNQLLIIKDLEFEVGKYTNIVLTIIDNDINRSFVKGLDDVPRELNVVGTTLALDGIDVDNKKQVFTVKFNFSQSLTFLSGSNEYRLTNNGIRVQDNKNIASLTGRVDSGLFDQTTPCNAKTDPEKGNRLFLYKGKKLNANNLADVYTSNSSTPIPANAISPFEVAFASRDSGIWEYKLGFLPPGDYTLAFTCNAETDDPVKYDALSIPLPNDQLYEITLDNAEVSVCDLKSGASCQ